MTDVQKWDVENNVLRFPAVPQLGWVSLKSVPASTDERIYFSIDTELVYTAFAQDFGPLDLSCMCTYIEKVHQMLADAKGKEVIHVTSDNSAKRANSACLLCCYLMVMHKVSPEDAYRPFEGETFVPYRDACCGVSTYHLTIPDVLGGLHLALDLGWYDQENFDVEATARYQRVEHGDMNWLVPDKFLAFAGPSLTGVDEDGNCAWTPDRYVTLFKSNEFGIRRVVRLNAAMYPADVFTDANITHQEIFFRDGSCPSDPQVETFFDAVATAGGPVAVHCKAGLGRTATLVGLWAMKEHRFPAKFFIGWSRLARPGSVLGPQQHYLHQREADMFNLCTRDIVAPKTPKSLADLSPTVHAKYGAMSPTGKFGEHRQGERLTSAKRKSQGLTPKLSPSSRSPKSPKLMEPKGPPLLEL